MSQRHAPDPGDAAPFATELLAEQARTTLLFSGELDIAALADAQYALTRALDQAADTVVIDLRGLSFLDSSGLRYLIAARDRCGAAERTLLLIRGEPQVQRVLEMTGLEGHFAFLDDPASS